MRLPNLLSAQDVATLIAVIEATPERDSQPNSLSLGGMKFASNLFYGSPALQAFLSSPTILNILQPLLGQDIWVRWDQAVWKAPGGPEFPIHQDNGYTGLHDEHVQLWLALTEMTPDNGGLVVIPGGHRQRVEHRWIGGHATAEFSGKHETILADPGDAILFSSFLPHSTTRNDTSSVRLAYVAEFLSASTPDPGVASPHFMVCASDRTGPTWVKGGVGGLPGLSNAQAG